MMPDVEIEVLIVRDEPTDKAILIQETLSSPKIWIPRSQIVDIEYAGSFHQKTTITIPEWLALEKELI
jgi:hypothetical protein